MPEDLLKEMDARAGSPRMSRTEYLKAPVRIDLVAFAAKVHYVAALALSPGSFRHLLVAIRPRRGRSSGT